MARLVSGLRFTADTILDSTVVPPAGLDEQIPPMGTESALKDKFREALH